MQLDSKKLLFDIKSSIDSIFIYLDGNFDFNHYESNKLLRRGVERELEIIGEAMNRLLKLNPEVEISNARKIVDLRNLVIHSYDSVDNIIIWAVISRDLPVLLQEVSVLLKD